MIMLSLVLPEGLMFHKAARTILITVFVLILLSGNVSPGLADIAPPPRPPGSNISPGGQTQVRMLEEHVYLDFDPGNLHYTEDTESYLRNPDYLVHVKADFSMLNLGADSETLQVRFPLSFIYVEDFLLINDFQVWVEGKPVAFEKKEYPNDQFQGEMKLWAEFPVTFLPEQEILIQVSYSLQSIDINGKDYVSYVFQTGAGWNGTIGKAELIVNLPYEYSQESIMSILPGGKPFGKTIRWTWQDFEPTDKDDFHIDLVKPETWKEVVLAKQAIKDHLKDGPAYIKLGTLYANIAMGKYEIEYPEYEKLAIDTLKKGIELSPEDPEPHIQLFYLYLWEARNSRTDGPQVPDAICKLYVEELNHFLMRDGLETNRHIRNDDIQGYYDGIDCPHKPTLTDLRHAFPSSTPTPIRTPTIDPYLVIATDTPTDKPEVIAIVPATYTPKPTRTLMPSKALTHTPSPLPAFTTTPTHIISPTSVSIHTESSRNILWVVGSVLCVFLFAGSLTFFYLKRTR